MMEVDCPELESKSHPKLNVTRRIGRTNLAKAAAGNAGAWIAPICPVETVERVSLKCEAHALSWQLEVLAQRQIPPVIAWPDNAANRSGPRCVIRLLSKGGGIEPADLSRRAGKA